MVGLRYVLPVVIVLGGAIVMAFGSETDLEGGAGIVSAGLAVWGMNWLYRASIEGDRVREVEEAARDYLDVHGHWPDEDAPSAPAPAGARAGAPAPAGASAPPAVAAAAAGARQDQAERDLTGAPAKHTPPRHSRPHTSAPSSRRPRG